MSLILILSEDGKEEMLFVAGAAQFHAHLFQGQVSVPLSSPKRREERMFLMENVDELFLLEFLF